jgi:hypothetical protein
LPRCPSRPRSATSAWSGPIAKSDRLDGARLGTAPARHA